MSRENSIATILRYIGIFVIALGFINLVFWSSSGHSDAIGNLSSQLGWSSFFSSIVSGVILIGFSEVISLLQGIYNQQANSSEQTSGENNSNSTPSKLTDRFIPTGDILEGIHAFYEKRNEQIKEIRSSRYDGIAVVDVGTRVDVLDVNGFTPKILSKAEVENYPELT